MRLVSRHPLSSTILVSYFCWWIFMTWQIFFRSENKGIPRCDFSPFVLPVFTLLFAFLCIAAWMIKYISSKEEIKEDYLAFIAIAGTPAILLMGYLLTES